MHCRGWPAYSFDRRCEPSPRHASVTSQNIGSVEATAGNACHRHGQRHLESQGAGISLGEPELGWLEYALETCLSSSTCFALTIGEALSSHLLSLLGSSSHTGLILSSQLSQFGGAAELFCLCRLSSRVCSLTLPVHSIQGGLH